MHDSLDLEAIDAALRQRAERRARVYRILRYVIWGLLGVGIVLSLLLIALLIIPISLPFLGSVSRNIRRSSNSLGFVEYLSPLAVVVISISQIVSYVLVYTDNRERAARANALLPTLECELTEGQVRVRAQIPGFDIGVLLLVAIVTLHAILSNQLFEAIIVTLILVLVPYGRRYRLRTEVRWLYWGPLAKGDYDGALRRVDALLRWMPHNLYYLSAKGFILSAAGRDAGSFYRHALQYARSSPFYFRLFMTNCADEPLDQKKYVEAFSIMEAAARITPENKSLYFQLARCYLEEGQDTQRALELIEYALADTKPPASNRFLERSSWSIHKALEARIAVLNGREARAKVALEVALSTADPTFLPAFAEVHLHSGYLCQSQGDETAAREHFEQARTLDPNGFAGKRAAEELAKTAV